MQTINQQRVSDVPVRILIPTESVGAVIGKLGATIRQITEETSTKVSIIRDDPSIPTTTLSEELLIVRGPIENCVNACREILKIVKIETTKKNPGFEAPLRMVVHNEYIGRVIGKEGKMIFSIKSESGTELAVSSLKDKNNTGMDVERIITIKGGLENALKALELIQTKVVTA